MGGAGPPPPPPPPPRLRRRARPVLLPHRCSTRRSLSSRAAACTTAVRLVGTRVSIRAVLPFESRAQLQYRRDRVRGSGPREPRRSAERGGSSREADGAFTAVVHAPRRVTGCGVSGAAFERARKSPAVVHAASRIRPSGSPQSLRRRSPGAWVLAHPFPGGDCSRHDDEERVRTNRYTVEPREIAG